VDDYLAQGSRPTWATQGNLISKTKAKENRKLRNKPKETKRKQGKKSLPRKFLPDCARGKSLDFLL
jgi:hypothetical protein